MTNDKLSFGISSALEQAHKSALTAFIFLTIFAGGFVLSFGHLSWSPSG
jgi:hypothetical protein